MLAVGRVQDTFAGEAREGVEGGEDETGTSTAQAGNSSRFVAIEYLSQITDTSMRIRHVRTYVI